VASDKQQLALCCAVLQLLLLVACSGCYPAAQATFAALETRAARRQQDLCMCHLDMASRLCSMIVCVRSGCFSLSVSGCSGAAAAPLPVMLCVHVAFGWCRVQAVWWRCFVGALCFWQSKQAPPGSHMTSSGVACALLCYDACWNLQLVLAACVSCIARHTLDRTLHIAHSCGSLVCVASWACDASTPAAACLRDTLVHQQFISA
jgi:hypothetical protein